MSTDATRDVDSATRALQALGDATRLKILLFLGAGELNVSELCERLSAAQPTVSHHLGLLRMAGMVEPRRDGKRVYYRLTSPAAAPGTVRVAAGAATIVVQFAVKPHRGG